MLFAARKIKLVMLTNNCYTNCEQRTTVVNFKGFAGVL